MTFLPKDFFSFTFFTGRTLIAHASRAGASLGLALAIIMSIAPAASAQNDDHIFASPDASPPSDPAPSEPGEPSEGNLDAPEPEEPDEPDEPDEPTGQGENGPPNDGDNAL